MLLNSFIFILLLYSFLITVVFSIIPFVNFTGTCPSYQLINNNNIPQQPQHEVRKLYVLTCDTYGKDSMFLQAWNVTGNNLRKQGVIMMNVCEGMKWTGFILKTIRFVAYLRTLSVHEAGRNHFVLMDSDSFWAVNHVFDFWTAYDCARKGKNILLSTEMNCWQGWYCKQEDLQKWYETDRENVPSHSIFVNAGMVAGRQEELLTMLEYIIAHNRSYLTSNHPHMGSSRYDDQHAFTDYALRIAKSQVALDYHQQVFGTGAIMGYRDEYVRKPFVCLNRAREFIRGCYDFSTVLAKQNFHVLNTSTCLISREYMEGMELEPELRTLAPNPVIWHAVGSKRLLLRSAHQSMMCYLRNATNFDTANLMNSNITCRGKKAMSCFLEDLKRLGEPAESSSTP